ncbi:DMT family transporter [Metabacillus halosaccharovorans]|uniref:DMT family transporter n=1 Tax=Metabacillus halosaccharovorans TaxID=930124 RepID=UPI001C1F27BA|nr:EamA family transporter [Metabacillus halosaccharovorans]MBU7592057.1 EamA family transporter [Metabacillus halosaccharovorans]
MNKNIAYVYILSGAALWGMIGLFVTFLYEAGFSPTQVVAIRAISASIFLLFFVFWKKRDAIKIKLSDSKYFVGTGVISIVFFNWCMFEAIKETSISVSSVLLYTAPAFVMIFSRFFFKELFTIRKILALIITFIGCILVIGLFQNTTESVTIYGLLVGLGSGFFYALYSIFGKFALVKYSSVTVTTYTFVFAAIAITPFSGLWHIGTIFTNLEVWLSIIGLGLFSTLLAFLLYTKGLESVESGRASILATVEPVVATLIGFLVFQEKLSLWQYVGIIAVIMAVFIVQEKKTNHTDIKIQTLKNDI